MIDKSFFIIRANPSLSGNVKLVVDSDYNLYMESFDANDTLRNQKFKHFAIKPTEYWKELLHVFFDGVENNSIFGVRNINDIADTYTDFRYQFDDTYFSGAQFVEDNFYKESYEYQAPLYIKKNSIPSDFVILRVDGIGSVLEDSDKTNFRQRVIDQWKFVKSYDLTNNSVLGQWLKTNFVDDTGKPEHPLIISHGDTELSLLSGIDVKESGWTTKYLNLNETQSNNTPIFRGEEYFTNLWQQNSIIYPDILNLKFLFDDLPATPTSLRYYTINRYIGFYVDEKVEVKTVTPFKGFDLKTNVLSSIEGLDGVETSEIPYLKDNVFVQEIGGRFYSFDPIKNGWKEGNTYWIEWKGNYYRLEKVINSNTDIFAPNTIIGDFLYKVISPIKIERDSNDWDKDDFIGITANAISTNPEKYAVLKRVTINDLGNDFPTGTTYKDRLTVSSEVKFNNITGKNIIENSNTVLLTFKRSFYESVVSGQSKLLFTLTIEESSNVFEIKNYEEADLYLVKLFDDYHVVKKYSADTPSLANRYYIQSDWAIDINTSSIESWINNGDISKDPAFYKKVSIESVGFDSPVPFFSIFRINFTDIKDFDFDRIETDYAKYEYEKKYELIDNVEPKFYFKEHRDNPLEYYTIKGDKGKRVPILDENNKPLTIRDKKGEVNYVTGNPFTAEDLYHKDLDGSNWQLFEGAYSGSDFTQYRLANINLNRDFYREEGYVWRLEDENESVLGLIDFRPTSDKTKIYEELSWGVSGKNEVSDNKKPLPDINSIDPNTEPDKNTVPVSSEYINSDELWEVRNNNLTSLWDKNQSVVKWGALNSIGAHDYPYRLNYSLDTGAYNRNPNPNTTRNYPERDQQNLDYFYRFNLLNKINYDYYSLHLDTDFFDIDKYLSLDMDYFESVFKTDIPTNSGLLLTEKYSKFLNKNSYSNSETIFKGVKYLISDVKKIVYDPVEQANTGKLIIDDIQSTPNTKYSDYRFTIIFGKKKSDFSNSYIRGSGNSNMGVDVYLNDYWKNVVVHLFVDTDETIQLTQNGVQINSETCEIDVWYKDINDSRKENTVLWDELEFKVNNFGINLRPRDFKLLDFINYIKNKNFEPNGLVNKEKMNFVHVYSDGSVKVMNWTNTDFLFDMDLPKEVVVKEKSYKTRIIAKENLPKFEINNTLENRVIVSDKINNPTNDPDFTIDGLQIGSVNDINSYNNYPIAMTITSDESDTRLSWEMDTTKDPSLFRYDGVYVPIFKNITLFRPLLYKEIRDGLKTPYLGNGNWKFYDPASSKASPDVKNFGMAEEILFSKCNNESSVLKIQDPDNKERSIYPMVDEYGYDYDARYLFSSNFEPGFNYLTKRIEVPKNDKLSLSGYTIHYDGVSEFLRIPDEEKFNQENYLVEGVNYYNYIDEPIDSIRRFYNFTTPTIRGKQNFTKVFRVINVAKYKITIKKRNGDPSTEEIELKLSFISKDGKTTQSIFYGIGSDLNDFYAKYDYNVVSSPTPISFNTDAWNSSGFRFKNFEFAEFNIVNLQVSITIAGNVNANAINDYIITLEMDNTTTPYPNPFPNKNVLDIQVDESLIHDNWDEHFGDVLIGGFLKKESETGDISNYLNFSRRSNASVFTTTELDVYDKSNLNSLGEKLWKEFAGISKNKRQGRINKPAYDYAKFPIPKNWDGYIYVNVLDILRPGAGQYLYNRITTGLVYGFHSYADPSNVLTDLQEFDRCTLYHFLEYGSQEPLPNTDVSDLTYGNTRFGAPVILNEFYKITGFENLPARGYTPSFGYRNYTGVIRIVNDSPFDFEPDRMTRLRDTKAISYIGKQNGALTSPEMRIQWSPLLRDKKFEFDFIPANGLPLNISISLIDPNDNQAYDDEQFRVLLDNEFSQTPYVVTTESRTNNVFVYKIHSTVAGSYYNFTATLKSNKDFIILSSSSSDKIQSVTRKFTKTSLRRNRESNRIKETSIEFFVKTDGWVRDWETILYKGSDNGGDPWTDNNFFEFTWAIGKFEDTGKIAFKTCHEKLTGGYQTHVLVSEFDLNDGAWHHVACISDLETRTKTIMVDGLIDKSTTDYLESVNPDTGEIIDRTPQTVELLAQFVERRPRFVVGLEHPSIGTDATLANKIRIGAQDSKTIYWSNVIRGLISPIFGDYQWQIYNWGATIDNAYDIFQENYISLDYYLRVDSDTKEWDILISTDSSVKNGRRNFGGFIDELRIWNYARSNDEINANWRYILDPTAYKNPLMSLIAYYRFDDGQGINNIADLTNGKIVKDISKWSSFKISVTNDGKIETETKETSYFYFAQIFYDGSFITIDDEVVDWDVSGANIIGISNERSVPRAPAPILTVMSRDVEPDTFERSKSMLTKRRMSRVIINIKEKIENVSASRTFQFRPVKWWLFKDLDTRAKNANKTSSIIAEVERQGKAWLTQLSKLLFKRR